MAIGVIKDMGAYSEASKNVQASKINSGNGINTSSINGINSSINNSDKDDSFKENNLTKEKMIASKIKATLSETNQKATRTRCEFKVNEPTNRISIKVIDRATDEVIVEIPPEESLDVLAKIWELAGLFVDEKR